MFPTRGQRNYFRRRLTNYSESSGDTSSSDTDNRADNEEDFVVLNNHTPNMPNRNASNNGLDNPNPEKGDQMPSFMRRMSWFSDLGSNIDDNESTGHFPNMANGSVTNNKLRSTYISSSRLRGANMNLSKASERYQCYIKQNKHLVRDIKDSADSVEHDINEQFKAISASLEEQKKRLLQEVRETRNARVAKVEDDQARAERTVKTLKGCRESLQKCYKMQPEETEYEARLNGICVESEAVASNPPPQIRYDLSWMQFEKDNSVRYTGFGQIKADRRLQLQLESEFGRGWLLKLSKARGIAVTMKGLIAVAECNANKVSVWQEVNGEYQRKFYLKTPWNIQGLVKPTDVAVIAGDRFVVVDATNTVKVFSACGEYDPDELIKEEGTTCVTSDPKLNGGARYLMDSRNDIARFDINGYVLRPLFAGTVSHAIATNGENVAISNLKEVKIFDVNSGKELLDFEARVRGLCFDDETKSILATTCDRQIAQFCSKTGQLLAYISEDILNDPWGLALIPGRRLAVADDQGVKIYRIIDP